VVERTAWLSGDLLLLAGAGSEDDKRKIEGSVAAIGDRPLEVVTQVLAIPNGSGGETRLIAVSRFGRALNGSTPGLTLTLGESDTAISLDATQRMESTAMLREELTKLGPVWRKEALQFLWTAISPSLDRGGTFPLAQLLAEMNQEFRPHLPQLFRSRDDPYAAHVDIVLKLDERAVWVQGWMHDRENATARLTVVAPEGARAELLPGLFRHRRQDIQEMFHDKVGVKGDRHGYMCFAELDGPSHVSHGWVLELETVFADRGERPVPPVENDPMNARERILPCLAFERPGSDELMRQHVHPAMSRIQERLRDAPSLDAVIQFGEPPPSPATSVIVPLYSKLWFLEYQMAQWAQDPELWDTDLIYVLDTPEQAPVLEERAYGLHSIYGVPFRLAVMKGNSGFAGANNAAAQVARTEKLLLMNSDVIPDAPGWLGRMTAFYDATPDIGALGAKLIYEDDSLQHAGIYFEQSAETPPRWDIKHFFKGQHRTLPAANVARRVPAVTGACMMVARDLYEQMGGLSHRYVQGGYEDTDFCLRVTDEGREHWYMPGAELYHLEAQSYPQGLRHHAARYNRWLHTELCGGHIAQVMAQHDG